MSQLTAFEVDDSGVIRRGKTGRPPLRGTRYLNVGFDPADRALLEQLAVDMDLSFREVLCRALRALAAAGTPSAKGGAAASV